MTTACSRCDGSGKGPSRWPGQGEECPVCGGTGEAPEVAERQRPEERTHRVDSWLEWQGVPPEAEIPKPRVALQLGGCVLSCSIEQARRYAMTILQTAEMGERVYTQLSEAKDG